jgi:hypothetical protein
MNLKIGVASVAASALIGTMLLGGCANQPHDKLYDWVSSQPTPNIEGGGKALGVDELKLVTTGEHAGYLGIGTIGHQCLVSFTGLTTVGDNHRVDRTSTTNVSLFGRFDDRTPLQPDGPLTVADASVWVQNNSNSCHGNPF